VHKDDDLAAALAGTGRSNGVGIVGGGLSRSRNS